MDNSEGSYAKKFYEGSYYESKIKDVDKKREENNNSPKNNNDYFLITSDPKKRMENLIKNFECMIGKRKSEILKEFDKISLKLKEYKNNSNFPNELDINKNENENENNLEEKSIGINKRISFDTTTTAFNFETFGKILNEMKETNSKFHKNIDKLIQDIKSNQLLLDQNNNLYSSETILDKQFEITEKNILIKKASCNYGLDNQFEIIKYDKENNLLIYIDNSNDLVLNLISVCNNAIIQKLIMKTIFKDKIREIRYFSKTYKNDDEDNFQVNYLLVSSNRDEVKIFEIKFNSDLFQDTLIERKHITKIYENDNKILSKELFDLSSCAIRFTKDIIDSQIIITCWEGKSIKIVNLFGNKPIKEINSKTSCNVKYCNVFYDQFLVFCGCNSQDNYTCANCIDLDKINDENIQFIKYCEKCEENKTNVFFNFVIYESNNNKFLIIVDEKGFIRIFNFEIHDRALIEKIFLPFNSSFKKDNEKFKERLNSIIIENDYLIITKKDVGFIYLVNINLEENKKLNIIKYFELFNDKIISLRKYSNDNGDYFLALGNNKLEDKKIMSFSLVL